MKRFVLLDTTPIPENGGALCLFEYGEDFVIKIQGGDGGQLMNTRMHGSEDALAEIPCKKVAVTIRPAGADRRTGHGLHPGVGTQALGQERRSGGRRAGARAWSNGIVAPLGEKSGSPLLDPRTGDRIQDVAKVLQGRTPGLRRDHAGRRQRPRRPDAESPTAGCTRPRGLAACASALRPKGVLAVWSASADRQSSATNCARPVSRPRKCKVYAHGNKGTRHTIWIAEKLKG